MTLKERIEAKTKGPVTIKKVSVITAGVVSCGVTLYGGYTLATYAAALATSTTNIAAMAVYIFGAVTSIGLSITLVVAITAAVFAILQDLQAEQSKVEAQMEVA